MAGTLFLRYTANSPRVSDELQRLVSMFQMRICWVWNRDLFWYECWHWRCLGEFENLDTPLDQVQV